MDFVETSTISVKWLIIKVVRNIFNSDKTCRSYSDLCVFRRNFLGHRVDVVTSSLQIT